MSSPSSGSKSKPRKKTTWSRQQAKQRHGPPKRRLTSTGRNSAIPQCCENLKSYRKYYVLTNNVLVYLCKWDADNVLTQGVDGMRNSTNISTLRVWNVGWNNIRRPVFPVCLAQLYDAHHSYHPDLLVQTIGHCSAECWECIQKGLQFFEIVYFEIQHPSIFCFPVAQVVSNHSSKSGALLNFTCNILVFLGWEVCSVTAPYSSWRMNSCRLPAAVYWLYSQLLNISGGYLLHSTPKARQEGNKIDNYKIIM
jgi:hypothetical protein